jgi:hypothetical protein
MSENTRIQLDPEQARQGRTGVGVRYMLFGGIAFALIAWGVVELFMR